MDDGGGGGAGAAWPRPRTRRPPSHLISIDPEDNLLTVSRKLRRHRVHFMPLLDREQNMVVAVLSHRSLLRHLLSTLTDTRPLFNQSVSALGVGSFGSSVVVVPNTTSVLSVLNVLAERRISSVPLVNEAGQVTDLYSRDDVAFLANDLSLRVLDAPVGEVRRAQATLLGPPLPLLTCHRHETLRRCLELFAAMGGRCQRLICVDEFQRCTGIVSLSDVFAYLSRPGPVTLRRDDGCLVTAGGGHDEGKMDSAGGGFT